MTIKLVDEKKDKFIETVNSAIDFIEENKEKIQKIENNLVQFRLANRFKDVVICWKTHTPISYTLQETHKIKMEEWREEEWKKMGFEFDSIHLDLPLDVLNIDNTLEQVIQNLNSKLEEMEERLTLRSLSEIFLADEKAILDVVKTTTEDWISFRDIHKPKIEKVFSGSSWKRGEVDKEEIIRSIDFSEAEAEDFRDYELKDLIKDFLKEKVAKYMKTAIENISLDEMGETDFGYTVSLRAKNNEFSVAVLDFKRGDLKILSGKDLLKAVDGGDKVWTR